MSPLLLEGVRVTSAVGAAVSTSVKVPVPPSAMVSEVGLTVTPFEITGALTVMLNVKVAEV